MTASADHRPAGAFEHRGSFPLPAPRERVFAALLRPAELERWFAEHARLEPRVGGAYAFYGRATLGTPGAGDATQVITALEPGRLLAYRWRLQGVDTEVSLTLADPPPEAANPLPGAGPGSQLEVVHRVNGPLPYPAPRLVVDDLWRLQVGNLTAHVSGSDNVVLPDFTSDKPEVRLSVEIAAPPAKVFRALLDPALMDRWLGGSARVDLARREISYGWSYPYQGRQVAGGPTRILELVENQTLVTDWPDWRGDPDRPPTRVHWLLDPLPPDGQRTRLTLVHAGFAHPVDRSDYQQGWGEFLRQLAQVAAG